MPSAFQSVGEYVRYCFDLKDVPRLNRRLALRLSTGSDVTQLCLCVLVSELDFRKEQRSPSPSAEGSDTRLPAIISAHVSIFVAKVKHPREAAIKRRCFWSGGGLKSFPD